MQRKRIPGLYTSTGVRFSRNLLNISAFPSILITRLMLYAKKDNEISVEITQGPHFLNLFP